MFYRVRILFVATVLYFALRIFSIETSRRVNSNRHIRSNDGFEKNQYFTIQQPSIDFT